MSENVSNLCIKCGKVHITVEELRKKKDEYGYGWRLMGKESGYHWTYIQKVVSGYFHMTCRFSGVMREWMGKARKNPWIVDGRVDLEARGKKGKRLKYIGRRVWVRMDSMDFNWVMKGCERCEEMFVMLKDTPFCRKCAMKEERRKAYHAIKLSS